jgi:hypothetical protein
MSPEELDGALSTVTEYLRIGWSTGGGRLLRHFVWSLWIGWLLVNLFDLSRGSDGTLTDAVISLFRAAMVGALTEDHLRCLLTESGEMRRWEEEIVTRQKVLKSSIPSPFRGRCSQTSGRICYPPRTARRRLLLFGRTVIFGRKDFLPVKPASGLSFLILLGRTKVRLRPLLLEL